MNPSDLSFGSPMFLAILPEILLVVLGGLVLLTDLLMNDDQRRGLGWLTAGGLVVIIAATVLLARPDSSAGSTGVAYWGGMLRDDGLAFIFKILFLFGAAITALFTIDLDGVGRRGEFYVLLLASTLGMNLMASAGDLIMLYLAIETTSIPLYILAGFMTHDEKSTESGFKYFLFGALTSTVMLYGFSLLFGFSGTTNLYQIADAIGRGVIPTAALVGSLVLVLVGFGFKVSAVPFHFWAPDVYEGAPTPVAGFLSTASKAAGFAVLVRVLLAVFSPGAASEWVVVIATLSVATMTLGNLVALAQKNMKRLLAYSSIAHAGYILIGVVTLATTEARNLGFTALVYYLIAYLLTNLAAFGVVVVFGRISGSDDISAYDGLSRRSPGLALVMLVAFLSLAGMPPLGGFVAKVFIFAAAVKANYVWLAVVGVLNAILGLYYYLTVLKHVYLYRSEENESQPLPIPPSYAIALVVLVVGIILVGTVFVPFFNWSTAAAAGF